MIVMIRWKVCKPSFVSPTQLRAARCQLKMSHADMARACHVDVSIVYDWEKSPEPIRIPPFSHLRILHTIISLAPHLAARRSNPDWKL